MTTRNVKIEPSKAKETVTFDGELIFKEQLKTELGGNTLYKFYDIGEDTVLSVVRFLKENGEEIASYAPHAPKNLKDVERALVNAGAIDGELPETIRDKLKGAGIK